MTTKIWRGDAPAVSQQTRITPSGVEIGDVFLLVMNGKTISVTATAATAANVCTLLAAAIAATNIPEFREFTVSNAGGSLLLTAATSGVPFTITASSTNGSSLGVTVATTTQGSGSGSAVNMTQSFRIPISADGDWTFTIAGSTSATIATGASAATAETAIAAAVNSAFSPANPDSVDVTRTTEANDYLYSVEFINDLGGTTLATAVVSLVSDKPIVRTTQEGSGTGTIRNEIQTIDTGTLTTISGGDSEFDLTFDGETIAGAVNPTTTAAGVEGQLEGLPNLTSVTVSKSGQVWTIEFTGADGSANQPQIVAGAYASTTATHAITVTTTPGSGSGSGANEVQTVTLNGGPTGGTFTLTFDGQTTSAIAYNASASTVDTALEALSNIGSGDVAVAGSAGGPYTVTFQGALAAANQPQMTADGSSLTGGAGEGISVSTEVASAGPNHWDTSLNWLPAGVPANGDDVRFEIGSSQCLYGLSQTSVTLTSLHVAMTYTGKIGLPRQNSSGYLEYRPTELAIGVTDVLIGHGDGSGPSKVALNTGSIQTALEVRDAGGSSESGIPTVTWRGTHDDNAILMFGGDVGIALYSDQTATVDTLVQRAGTLDAKHTEFITSILIRSAKFFDCTLAGQPIEAY